MPIDAAKLAALLLLQKPACMAYWLVQWDPDDSNEDRYYSDSIYSQLPPYTGVGVDIEARIIISGTVASATQFEINPDLKTEKIGITFDDIDKVVSGRFQTFKSGIRCELFFYYPDVDLTVSMWFGQLQAPEIYGHKDLKTTATNGYRSREQLIPRRMRPRECTANWGGWMPSEFASETNLCPAGPFGTIASADLDCPRDSEATCDLKLGTTDADYYGGFNTDAATISVPNHDGGIAVSRGNQSSLSEPIRAIFGTKYVRSLPLLLWRRDGIGNNSFVSGLWEVGEGPVSQIYNIKVNDLLIGAMHISSRVGTRGQPRSTYTSDVSHFSNTAHFYCKFGPTNPANYDSSNLNAECQVVGFSDVAVFTNPSTYTRIWTDSRIWCLMECYTNQRFGMAYPSERFTIADWITADTWSTNNVRFTALFMDGESKVYQGRRTTFDCVLEGRPVAEQIEDICRSGAISVPFQYEGKYTIRSFRPATAPELAAARIFTDDGQTRNIIWGDGQPNINLSQTPDDKVVNEIELKFEEAANGDIERPVKVDDPNQKLKAGRVLGEDNLQTVPKRFAAFGIKHEHETVRLAYRLLRFGEFDEGGTQNNLKAVFTTPFEQALGIVRYDIIKIVSTLLDQFTIGTDNGVEDLTETPQYFRVQKLKKVGNGLVEITAQAYNQTAYEAFESVVAVTACTIDAHCPPGQVCENGFCVPETGGNTCSTNSDCPEGFFCLAGRCVPEPTAPTEALTIGATYDQTNGIIEVTIT